MPVKLTLDQVLSDFRAEHKDRYDYTEFEYEGNNIPSTIICKEHGRFLQNAHNHKSGAGCPSCAGVSIPTRSQVLSDFRIEHGDKYDYSEFVVSGSNKKKSTIICPTHGRFQQNTNNHKNGQGCPGCAFEESKSAWETVLLGFRKEHGDKYDYSKFIYINGGVKGIIICPVHGEFLQTAANHLTGRGCPSCKNSKGEKEIARILDSLSIVYERQKKFPDCRHINQLSFDFYLPNHNLLIEFDGAQHFEPVKVWGGIDGFNLTKLRDSIKNEYCTTNGINLLRIPYSSMDVESMILSYISLAT